MTVRNDQSNSILPIDEPNVQTLDQTPSVTKAAQPNSQIAEANGFSVFNDHS